MGCMTKAEITKLLTLTAAMYPRFEINELKVELWLDLIGDIPFKVAQMALKKVMLSSKFPPTVAEIREAAAEITAQPGEVLDAGKAWGEVTAAISKWGFYEPGKALDMMSPLTQQVVKQISWREICCCEELGVVRGQFMKMFNSLFERKRQDKMLPEKFKSEISFIANSISVKQIGGSINEE